MLFDFNEKNVIKNKDGEIQYYKQIKPFTFGEMFNGLVCIEKFGECLMFFSKNTKLCLGTSHISTLSLFEAV